MGRQTVSPCPMPPLGRVPVLVAVLLLEPSSRPVFSVGAPVDGTCNGAISRVKYSQLHRHCDDCFNLYPDPFVFGTCKSNCFRNDLYYFCLNVTQVSEEDQQNVGIQLAAIDGGHFIGFDVDSK